MEETFRKYCVYYATDKTEEYLEQLKEETKDNVEEYQKKAIKFVKNLRHKAGKLGYEIDFESFCNLLEEYIAKKDDLEDKEKRAYLKVLFSLSKIYEVNLREELEKYVSYKKVSNRQITERDVFKQFCLYNLSPNNDVGEFNRLTSVCNINNLNFEEINQKSLIFVEEIKMLLEKIGYTATEEDIYKMIEQYKKEKNTMDNTKKVGFLKLLFYLCELYNIDLRELISKKEETNKETNSTLSLNPLENDELISNLLKERYSIGSFEIENFLYNNSLIVEEEYNYNKEISSIAYNIFQIFIDKFNNYAYDDLNPIYSNMITEEDMVRFQNLTMEEIEHILIEEEKHESRHYICKKFKLPENLYNFITKAINETINLKTKSIGMGTQSLFNLPSTNNSISIYLNGPDKTIIEILKKYIKKCLDNNLNYELDGLCYDTNTFKTIIYSNKKDFKQKINILEDILANEDISSKMTDTLSFSCHQQNKLYSISRRNIYNKENYIPYIEYTNNLLEVSYYRTISKIVISKIDNAKDQEIINNIIELDNVSCSSLNPQETLFNEISFKEIKDTINNYIPLINNTLSKYILDNKYNKDIIEEFKKAIIYISNIIEEKDKKEERNITVE